MSKVVYGDYRTAMLGALRLMGQEATTAVTLAQSLESGGYVYGWVEDIREEVDEKGMEGYRFVFTMDAGDAIHMISCRFEDLFKAVENASN